MINRLFRTQFESHASPFIMFLALNGLLCFLLLQVHIESDTRPVTSNSFVFIVFWLLTFCLVTAGIGLMRHNRERRTRLFAQLPASPREVRLAYWCLAALFIFISTGVLTLLMLFAGVTPLASVLGFALLYFFHAGVLLAVISILTSNNMPLIPEDIRRRTILYFFMAAFLTFLTLFVMGLLVAGYARVMENAHVDWTILTVLMVFACAGLVTLDVHLFQRKDNYLG